MHAHSQLPNEFYLPDRPGSAQAVEHICALATNQGTSGAVAVAVAPANVSRASNLLFGTGVGVVSALDAAGVQSMVGAARLSVATGATEIALPRMVLDEPALLLGLKSFLGTTTPITVDITASTGDVDLVHAENALLLGADYVAFAPENATSNPTGQTANLLELAGELQLGGVKIASASHHHHTVLRSNEWAMAAGNARRCLPIAAPEG